MGLIFKFLNFDCRQIPLWPFLEIFVPKPLKCIFHKFLYLTSQISSLYIGALCLKQNCTCFWFWISNLRLQSLTNCCFFNFGWKFTMQRRNKIISGGHIQLYSATNSAFLYQSICKEVSQVKFGAESFGEKSWETKMWKKLSNFQ